MLTAEHITFRAGNKMLLDDVSVVFAPGKLNLIIGPNGAGKSTLIKVLCSQFRPHSGSVLYSGKNITAISISELARFRSVLSQSVDITFPLKAREVVMMGRYPHFTGTATKKDQAACDEAMQFFDVSELADRDFLTLSGGEKQRVHFARVAAQIWIPYHTGCRYLFLDEPLTFLDVHYQFDFMHKMVKLLSQQDIVIVGVVHDLNLAARFADQITLLHHGRVLASGTRDHVLIPQNISTAYQLTPVIHRDNGAMHIFFD